MQDVTRRSFLTTTAAIAAGTALPASQSGAQTPKRPELAKGTRELLAVGPLSLKEFMGPGKGSEEIGDGLKVDEVVKQLHVVELTIIDRRVWDGTRWIFDDVKSDGFPRLAVSGALSPHLEVDRGNEYWFAIRELDTLGSDTDNTSEPATRRFPVVIKARFFHKNGEAVSVSGLSWAFPDRQIAYTVLGNRLTKGKDGKWTSK